jgi:hypothetical protein
MCCCDPKKNGRAVGNDLKPPKSGGCRGGEEDASDEEADEPCTYYKDGSKELLKASILRNHSLLSVIYVRKYDKYGRAPRAKALVFTLFVIFMTGAFWNGILLGKVSKGGIAVIVAAMNMLAGKLYTAPFIWAQKKVANAKTPGETCCGKAIYYLIIWVVFWGAAWGVFWVRASCIAGKSDNSLCPSAFDAPCCTGAVLGTAGKPCGNTFGQVYMMASCLSGWKFFCPTNNPSWYGVYAAQSWMGGGGGITSGRPACCYGLKCGGKCIPGGAYCGFDAKCYSIGTFNRRSCGASCTRRLGEPLELPDSSSPLTSPEHSLSAEGLPATTPLAPMKSRRRLVNTAEALQKCQKCVETECTVGEMLLGPLISFLVSTLSGYLKEFARESCHANAPRHQHSLFSVLTTKKLSFPAVLFYQFKKKGKKLTKEMNRAHRKLSVMDADAGKAATTSNPITAQPTTLAPTEVEMTAMDTSGDVSKKVCTNCGAECSTKSCVQCGQASS